VETNEAFRVTISAATGGAMISGTNITWVTITENDVGLAFSAATYAVSEAGTNVTLTVVQTGDLSASASVDYVTSDSSAIEGADYTGTNGTLNFGPGTNSLTIVVPITEDSTVETNEIFRVSLTNALNAVLLARSNAVVTILENDSVLSLSTNAISVNENGTRATLTVVRTGGTNATATVDFATADGSATNAVDYMGTNGTLSFGPGVASRTITVPIINDSIVDGDNSFVVSLSNPSAAALGAVTNTTVTILDNDSTFEFSTNAVSVAETAGAVTLTVVRSGGLIGAATVRYATTNDSATAGSDYTARSGILSFRAAETNKLVTITVANDIANETNEVFNIFLSSPAGEATLGANNPVAVTITDNDSLLAFDTNAVTVAENAGTATLTVNRTGTLTGTNTIAYTIIPGTAGTSDYTATSGVLTFVPNATNATITISITEDSVIETNESFTVRLSSPTGGALLSGTNTARITITEDDAGLAFSGASYSVSEVGTNVSLTVVQTGNLDISASVDYAMSDTGAVDGADYTGTNVTLDFGPGTNSLTITIPVLDDSTIESNETFRVSLTNVTGAILLTRSNAVVTILEDDSSIAFTTNAMTMIETVSSVTLTVLRTGGTNFEATVGFATTTNSTATAGADYTSTNGTITFSPGVRSRTITIPLANDSSVEENETMELELSNVTDAILGSHTNAAVTILDNDSIFSISTNVATVAENAVTTSINIRRAGGLAGVATVRFGTTNGTAIAGSDYRARSGTLRFLAGETNKIVALSIMNDLVVDANETFTVGLSAPTGEATLGTNVITFTIVDNDFVAGDVVTETPSAALAITSLGFSADGAALLEVEGPLGAAVSIETSPDLRAWSEIASALLGESAMEITDVAAAGHALRFYRVRQPEAVSSSDDQ
jgi:azurin